MNKYQYYLKTVSHTTFVTPTKYVHVNLKFVSRLVAADFEQLDLNDEWSDCEVDEEEGENAESSITHAAADKPKRKKVAV